MKNTVLAALAALLSLPLAAQQETKSPEGRFMEPRTQAVGAPAPARTADKPTTPRENARIAKAQNKDTKCATSRERQPRPKKAAAT